MTDQAIHEYGREKVFQKQTLDRWLKLPEPDRKALLELARGLKMGENHFRDFLDWLEEISLRDDTSLCQILKGESIALIWADARLGRNDKLKRIKEELRCLRFPRLVRLEGEIHKKIRQMGPGPQIQMTVVPGLEGGALTVQLMATSHEELQRLLAVLGQLSGKTEMKEIFDLLAGREQGAELSA